MRYYENNFNDEVLERDKENLANLQYNHVPHIDDEDMRMSLIIIQLLNKRMVTEQYIADWIELMKNKLEISKTKQFIYYGKAKNLNDFIKSFYFEAKN